MYGAKRRGRGEFASYDAQLIAGAQTRFSLERRLQGALERGEFSVHYQPQFNLATGRISGWRRCCAGRTPSSRGRAGREFVALAEKPGYLPSAMGDAQCLPASAHLAGQDLPAGRLR